MKIIKSTHQGNEGLIKFTLIKCFGLIFLIALSETKWHHGEKYKKAPIWVSKFAGINSLFIHKLGIGIKKQ